MDEQYEQRLTELEITCALQDELLASLNDTVAQMRETLDLQQAQLRLLYRRLERGTEEAGVHAPFDPAEQIPPHY